ncbi:MAG: dienelactone hydrolase family protein [Nitrospirae bacterium]|nr:dienelactone hydrolase family protein [Nitrospirota bacterium]
MKNAISFSLLVLVLALASLPAHAAVIGKEVDYRAGDTVLKGFLAYDDAKPGKRPGVLVVHEWWGLNDYARKRATMLAELGYTALAVDMYGNGKTTEHSNDAGAFTKEVTQNLAVERARFQAALDLLKAQPTTDPAHIAAIGYCFGGGVVLQMAREGAPLAGVASFHGSLGTDQPAKKGVVKARVLVLHGADDPFVPQEQIEQFKQEMTQAGVDFKFIAYSGATHGFTNPDADRLGAANNMPIKYNAKADQASWAEMQAFFTRIFTH